MRTVITLIEQETYLLLPSSVDYLTNKRYELMNTRNRRIVVLLSSGRLRDN